MKNFKTVNQSPLGQTNAFEESNVTGIKIPRRELPYDHYIGVRELAAPVPVDAGKPIEFEVSKQTMNQGLIKIVQNPAAGSNPSYTSFFLKPGHIYRAKVMIFEDATTDIGAFGFFDKKNVLPTFDVNKSIGKIGQEVAIGGLRVVDPSEAFIDTLEEKEDFELVVAIISGSGSKTIANSYVIIEAVTNRSGPWN